MNPFLIFKAMAGISPVDMGLMVRDWKTVIRFQFLQAAKAFLYMTKTGRPA